MIANTVELFSLKYFLVNLNRSAGNCGVFQIYKRNRQKKTFLSSEQQQKEAVFQNFSRL